jgi:uncharacterized BrkB/YihY/UPF0761 family membrane protein
VESLRWEQRFGAGLLSGGIAYRFFLWLVPFGLAIAAIASFWVRISHASLENTAKSFGLGGVAAHSAASAVEDGSKARWYLLGAGLVLIAWAGIGSVRALRVASRLAWGIDPDRMRHPLRSSATFTVLGVVGLAASMAASWARHNLAAVGLVITLADVLVYFVLALFAFGHLPRPDDTSWRVLWPGAVLVAIGVTAVHIFLAYYLAGKLERSPALYGTLGAATVVLLVLFLIARLIVSAMFLNATLQRLPARHPD